MGHIGSHRPPNGGNNNGGGTGSNYDSGIINNDFLSVSEGTYNISSGAYKVEVWNEGVEDVTVNGKTLTSGEYWSIESQTNPHTQKVDYCPPITIIVPLDGAAKYQEYRPS